MSARRRSLLSILGTVTVLVLACLTFAALAGAQEPTIACPPPPAVPQGAPAPTGPQPAPEHIVVCVGAQPITVATFLHWSDIARRSEEPSSKHHSPTDDEVLKEVMGFLISSDWVLEEARIKNVAVSDTELRYAFDRIRGQQFPKRKEFRAFLKQSGQTVADLLLRVKLNILSQRIQNRILTSHPGRRSGQRALTRFVHEFRAKWTAQTYCEPAYAVPDCSHVQAPL